MGLSSIGRILGFKKKEKPVQNSKDLADQLYKNASEKEKDEIREQYQNPVDPRTVNRNFERREATIAIPEGPHLEALVRRELLARAEETRGELRTAGGNTLSFIKEITESKRPEERVKAQEKAHKIATVLLDGYSAQDRRNILQALQSLDEASTLKNLPTNIQTFFQNTEKGLADYCKRHQQNISFSMLKGHSSKSSKKKSNRTWITKKQS